MEEMKRILLFPQQGSVRHIQLCRTPMYLAAFPFSKIWMRVLTVMQISEQYSLQFNHWTKETCIGCVSGQRQPAKKSMEVPADRREMIQQLRALQRHGGGCSSSLYDGGMAMEITEVGRMGQQRKTSASTQDAPQRKSFSNKSRRVQSLQESNTDKVTQTNPMNKPNE